MAEVQPHPRGMAEVQPRRRGNAEVQPPRPKKPYCQDLSLYLDLRAPQDTHQVPDLGVYRQQSRAVAAAVSDRLPTLEQGWANQKSGPESHLGQAFAQIAAANLLRPSIASWLPQLLLLHHPGGFDTARTARAE